MQRRATFREWADRAAAVLAQERRRVASGQQLLASIRAQVKERTEAEEEFAKRLAKVSEQRDGELASSRKGPAMNEEDAADARYLNEMQKYCSRFIAAGARSCRAAIEKSETLAKWDSISKGVMKRLPLAEHALKAAEACDGKCTSLWGTHETSCRKRLDCGPGAAAAAARAQPSDLFASEAAYRRNALLFDAEVAKCHAAISELQQATAGAQGEHRSLARQAMRDVAGCLAALYSGMAQALTPPSGGTALAPIPGSGNSHGSELPAAPAVAPALQLPAFEPLSPHLPPSALVLHHGPVQRPPNGLALFGGWHKRHLLLSVDGFVHCFGGADDLGNKQPLWSLAPSPGVGLAVDAEARQMRFMPASGWAWRRNSGSRLVRLSGPDELATWERALRPWWPPVAEGPGAAAAPHGATAAAGAGPTDEASDQEPDAVGVATGDEAFDPGATTDVEPAESPSGPGRGGAEVAPPGADT